MDRSHARRTRALLVLALSGLARAALADDVADEADLHFRIGTEAYAARDFRGALEHFLASNRLVANRNVVFNIARSFEQLGQFSDAHRYYTQALDGENDPRALTNVRSALQRIGPYVAVLRVITDPPGATIYIDRRDLGQRGTAPRALAFNPGRMRVIAELDGHTSATSEPVDLRVGQETTVQLHLERILGSLRVESAVPNTVVRVDDEQSAPACTAPCALGLSPGRHTLFGAVEGHQTAIEQVTVEARGQGVARLRPAPITGTLVVGADERDALVEVDGRPVGFTPLVTQVQIGGRRVRVSAAGYRPYELAVTLRQGEEQRVEAQLRRIEEVSAASRVAEQVEDAPSSVTLIPSQELRGMAYPTIAEALRGVRGVSLTDDRQYISAGFRGFGRPGDYGNRVLVLLDGHPTNDNWVGSSYIGYDARTDIDDVERIEVVRGPGSVLYGTGAFSGVVNVVTRGRGGPTGGDVTLSGNEYGVARARGGMRLRLGSNAGVWASLSAARGEGRDFYLPEQVRAPMGAMPGFDGNSRGSDGFESATTTGRAWWRDLTFQWLYHSREKALPNGVFETVAGDPRSQIADTRALAELRFEPRIGQTLQLMARTFINHYRYRSDLLDIADRTVARQSFDGSWGGGELRLAWTPSSAVRVTLGGEGQYHFQARQRSGTVADPGDDVDRADPFSVVAAYGNVDITPSQSLRITAGGRLDSYSTVGSTFSPRFALIVRPYSRGNLKLMAGRAFRAPSIYELFYNDNDQTQRANPRLEPETVWSGELEYSHRLSATWTALASAYGNYIQNLIALRDVGMGVSQYQTTDAPVLTLGAEAELRREWRQGWMFSAQYSFQNSRYQDDPSLRQVPNVPEHLFSVRAAAPVVAEIFTLSTRLSVEGPRWDRNDRNAIPSGPMMRPADPAQTRTDTAVLWDVVLSGRAPRWKVRYAFGVYNLFDWRYSTPVSSEFPTAYRTAQQNGRTFLAQAGLEF